jgi:hypothetical protein
MPYRKFRLAERLASRTLVSLGFKAENFVPTLEHKMPLSR